MKVLLAESGASKTEWCLCEPNQAPIRFQSPGLNPSTLPAKKLREIMAQTLGEHSALPRPDEVRFYGAGLRNPEPHIFLQTTLQSFFSHSHIRVYDDLLAAVHALDRVNGVVAILGTGSNACYYQEGEILSRAGGLGYLLGDEGAGVDLGRAFLRAMLTRRFSARTLTAIQEIEPRNAAALRDALYQSPQPTAFLAAFAPVLNKLLPYPEIRALVSERFEVFVQETLLALEAPKELPVDFVGSIAVHFNDLLADSLSQMGLRIGKTLSNPIDQLIHKYSHGS